MWWNQSDLNIIDKMYQIWSYLEVGPMCENAKKAQEGFVNQTDYMYTTGILTNEYFSKMFHWNIANVVYIQNACNDAVNSLRISII